MGFNAGAIEGTVTLDRRPFTQGLASARRQGRRFANETFTASMDVDTSAANASIRKLRADMARAESLSRHMSVTADTSGATAAMRAVEAQQRRMAAGSSQTSVGVDTSAAMMRIAALEAQLERLNTARAEPTVGVRGVGAALAQVDLLQTAVIGLGPAVVPVLAAATGGAVALVGALGAAAGALGVFGLAAAGPVVGLINLQQQMNDLDEAIMLAEPGTAKYNELLAEQAELLAQVTPAQRAALDSFEQLKTTFLEFGGGAEDNVLGAITNGLNGVRGALEILKPAVVPISLVMLELSRRFEEAMTGPGMVGFRDWIMTNGPPAILWFVGTLVNLGATVAGLVVAFQPLTDQLVATEGAFAGMRTWSEGLAANPQFQEFLSYIIQHGPLVSTTLFALVDAVLQIGWALAPVAPYLLMFVRGVAETAASVASAHPWVIQLAWAGLLVAKMWGPLVGLFAMIRTALTSQAAMWLLLRARMIAYRSVTLLIRTATLAWVGVQWLLNIAMNANPLGLIVLAVVAVIAIITGLVLAIKYAWNNFDWFRNGVLAVWTVIQAGAMWLWTNGIKPVVDWIVMAFQTYLLPAIIFVATLYVNYIQTMWKVVQTLWSFIWPIIQFIALVAFALVVTYLGVLWSYWKFVFNAIGAIATWLWQNAIKPAVDGIVWLWVNWLMPKINQAKAGWDIVMNALGAAARWLWTNVIKPVVLWIAGRWAWLVMQFQYHRAVFSAIFAMIGAYVSTLRDRFRAGFDKIKEFASSLLTNLRGMRDSVGEIFRRLANHARTPINWVINTVYNDGIRKISRNVLTAVGMTDLANKIPRAATIPAFAAGGSPMDPSGYVRGAGSGTSDDIVARIANREFVVNARSTAAFRPWLEWVNNQGRRARGNSAAAMPGNTASMPGFNRGGLVNPFDMARDAVLGASKGVLEDALDALGWTGWIRELKAGAPIWQGAAGGALDMVGGGLLSFLGRKDAEGGNPTAVVRAARAAKMEGSDSNNRYTRAFGMLGAPWCAMFVSEMLKDAKAQKLYANVRSAAVQSFATSSMSSVAPSAARAGDLAVYRGGGGPGGWSHINIVSDPTKRESIGGNEGNRIKTQRGYYPSAVKLMRPSAAMGGLITDSLVRRIMSQDYADNTRRTTPEDTQFVRVLAGLPAYGDGGRVEYRAGGGRLRAGDTAWVGEEGPELVRVGSQARVHSAPESAAIAGRGGATTYNYNVSGIATIDELRAFAHETRVAEQRRAAAGTIPGPPKPKVREG